MCESNFPQNQVNHENIAKVFVKEKLATMN